MRARSRRTSWWRAWWLGALVGSVVLAGCTSPGEDGGDDADGEQLTAYDKKILRAADPEATGPAKAVEGALNGGTITVLSSRSGPKSLNGTGNGHSRAIRALVTRGLTQYELRNGEPVLVPDLATDLGTSNKAGTRWEFTLREGVLWEDGDPVTSEDVARGIEAALDSPAGERYFAVDSDGKSDGSEASDDTGAVVRTPDEQTVVVRTERPFGDLPYFVASPNVAAVPSDDKPATLASGPYTVEKLSAEAAVLLPNDYWDPSTDPVRQQYPDKWSFDFNRDAEEIQQRVAEDGEQGQVTIVPDDLDPETDAQVLEQAGDRALVEPGRCVEVAYLNPESLSGAVRKAVLAATPREATSLLPEWMPGRVNGPAKANGDSVTSKKVLEKADELAATLTIYAVDDEEGQAAQQQAERAYEKAGFQVETETIARSDLKEIADGSEEPSEDVSLWPGELCAEWPSGGGLFPLLEGEGSVLADVGGLEQRMRKIERQQRDTALAAWGKLDRQLIESDPVVVPIRNVPDTALAGSRIDHLRLNPITGEPDYASVFLAE